MITQGTLLLRRPVMHAEGLTHFRWGRVGTRVVLTTDAGQWHLLDPADFDLLLAGGLHADHPQHGALLAKGFLREDLDVEALASAIRRKKRFLDHGPHLHIVLTTLRCNQGCSYCHASRADIGAQGLDMTLQTAKKVVDIAMTTSSPYVNFEFQGGEPTLNMDALKFIVEYARERNRVEGKRLELSVVTNLTSMTEEKARWLVDHDILVCTSLDGPQDVHDFNRAWTGGSAWEQVMHWIRWFNSRWVEAGRDPELWHVDALMTTTRKTLGRGPEVVALYESLGIRNIHLRPLNPYGFAVKTWQRIGYTVDEYLDFYGATLDHVIQRNLDGAQMIEGTATTFLAKMLTADDPNFVDIRSSCGASIGQVAYNQDGRIYTCDEARMTAAMGDHRFAIGDVADTTLATAIQHPTVKAMAVASIQDALPGCDTCWNKPFCGVCPMHNHVTFGDIFGQRPRSPKCREYLAIATLLVERLAADTDGRVAEIFQRWTINRPRFGTDGCPT